ncbi:hypothetical protein SDJN03_16076, partial [Cucurbita argyrosperma subsp. sororia]
MVGPRTVHKLAKKPNETPRQHSTTEKFNDSEEKFERMINCITTKEREMKQLLVDHQHLTRRLSVSLSSSRSGRRKSICGSQIQLAELFANNGVKVVSADMPPFMQIHAVDCARKAHDSMQNFTSKSLALSLKQEFDGSYGAGMALYCGEKFWIICDTFSGWIPVFFPGSKALHSALQNHCTKSQLENNTESLTTLCSNNLHIIFFCFSYNFAIDVHNRELVWV